MDKEKLLELAKQNLERDGSLVPCVIVESDEEVIFVAFADGWPKEQRDRRKLVGHLGILLGFGMDAKHFTVLNEVWVSKRDTVEGPRPSEDPDRSEAIMIVQIPKEGQAEYEFCEFTHQDSKIVFEKPLEEKSERFEDYTFSVFWDGVKFSENNIEEICEQLGLSLEHVFEDTGKTAEFHARRAAMNTAMSVFGAEKLEI